MRTHPGGAEGARSEVGVEDVFERVRLILKFRVSSKHDRLSNVKSRFRVVLTRLGVLGFLLQSVLHCSVQLCMREVRFFCEMMPVIR